MQDPKQIREIGMVMRRVNVFVRHGMVLVYGPAASLVMVCLFWFCHTPTALASVHTYPDPNRHLTMYRSLQALRDEADRAWQTVFYKQVKDGLVQDIHLRLVGFPGATQLAHPRSLQLLDRNGHTWEAPDIFAQSNLDPALAANVGEYDVMPIVQALEGGRSLWLRVAVGGDEAIEIPVPPFAVREWQQVLDR